MTSMLVVLAPVVLLTLVVLVFVVRANGQRKARLQALEDHARKRNWRALPADATSLWKVQGGRDEAWTLSLMKAPRQNNQPTQTPRLLWSQRPTGPAEPFLVVAQPPPFVLKLGLPWNDYFRQFLAHHLNLPEDLLNALQPVTTGDYGFDQQWMLLLRDPSRASLVRRELGPLLGGLEPTVRLQPLIAMLPDTWICQVLGDHHEPDMTDRLVAIGERLSRLQQESTPAQEMSYT
jgi:hypothetical protein